MNGFESPSATLVERPRIVDPRLVGRCGMYCGHCHIHRAYKDSPALRVKLAAKHRCPVAAVKCDGCQVSQTRGWTGDPNWGKNCRILRCLASKNLRFCYECSIWPGCPGWSELAESRLMFGVDLKANLEMLRAGRVREWLEEQDSRWRCIHCQAPIPVSTEVGVCLKCGKVPDYR